MELPFRLKAPSSETAMLSQKMLLSTSDRRKFLMQSLATSSLLAITAATTSKTCAQSLLVSTGKKSSPVTIGEEVRTRVKSVLEVRGEVRLKTNRETPSEAVRRAALESKTTLQYEEVFAISQDSSLAALQFQIAESNSTVEKHAADLKLRDQSKTMIRWTKPNESNTLTAGVDQPLTETERKLAESPVVTMFLDLLLPPSELGVGEKYSLESSDVARLLHLDAVQRGTLTVVVIDRSAEQENLEISGDLSASVNAVPTTISFTGKATVDRATQIVSYLAASISEEREIGLAEPGFQVTARLRLIREKKNEGGSLKTLSEYASIFQQRQEHLLQAYESKDGGYRFFADSDWVIYKDSEIDAVLRLVRNNRSLGQCNIVNLADMEPGKQLTIDAFKQDVQRILGKSYGRIIEESERVTNNKLRMMRVVAGGQIEGVEVVWINMLISNDEGRHVSVVFTTNVDRMGELHGADIQLADTFEFTKRLKSVEEQPSVD